MDIIGTIEGKRYILIVESFCASWQSLETGERMLNSPVWSEDHIAALEWFHDQPGAEINISW